MARVDSKRLDLPEIKDNETMELGTALLQWVCIHCRIARFRIAALNLAN